MARLLSETRVA